MYLVYYRNSYSWEDETLAVCDSEDEAERIVREAELRVSSAHYAEIPLNTMLGDNFNNFNC